MILYYQNSILASAVSIFGCIAIIMGVTDSVPDKFLFIGLGIALLVAGKLISNRKAFKKWWKQVEDAGLEERIKTDVALAKAIYSKNPIRATLKKIQAFVY